MSMSEYAAQNAVSRIAAYVRETDAGTPSSEMHLLGVGAVGSLEAKLCQQYQTPCAVAVSNATTGLLGVALAFGLRNADIITTPWTWAGTIAPFLLLGNRIAFADIDHDTLTIDPKSLMRLVTGKTKAIVAADVFGVPCDVQALRKVADRYGLRLVVDCAQSFGAIRDGLPAGSGADAAVLSFGVGKGICAGEGGAVLGNPELFQQVLWFLQHGTRQRRQLGLALENEFAFNGRIHPIAAIWADARFDAALQAVKTRRVLGLRVVEALNQTGLTMPCDYASRNIRPSFDRLTAAWKLEARPSDLIKTLREHDIAAEIGPIPTRLLYTQPAFLAQYKRKLVARPICPVAEDQVRRRFELRVMNGVRCREVA